MTGIPEVVPPKQLVRHPNLRWISTGSSFPPANTPIYHIPTARINYTTDDYGTAIWLSRIDQLISRRLDRKGIIFTVSYQRRDLLLRRSQYSNIMVTHQARDVIEQVQRFKKMPAPAILVSPTVTTGWDFPGDQCMFIIIGKLPYPDTSDLVTKARHEEDKEWTGFLAMGTMIQSAGRGTRSAEDKCEVFICDDSIKWFWAANKRFAPQWFRDRYRGSLATVPNPLF